MTKTADSTFLVLAPTLKKNIGLLLKHYTFLKYRLIDIQIQTKKHDDKSYSNHCGTTRRVWPFDEESKRRIRVQDPKFPDSTNRLFTEFSISEVVHDVNNTRRKIRNFPDSKNGFSSKLLDFQYGI